MTHSPDPSTTIHIKPLQDCPHAVPTIARWRFDQWGPEIPDSTQTMFTANLEAGLRGKGLPKTWVAFRGERVVGAASLAERDMHTRPHLFPWLVGVYVNAADRGKGIGSVLVRHLMDQAQVLGIQTLWLFTDDQERFYQRLGWQTTERTYYRGHSVVVMKADLQALDTYCRDAPPANA